MDKVYRIIAINPGSTSTKVAVFDDEEPVYIQALQHGAEEINRYAAIYDQLGFRKGVILRSLEENNIPLCSINAVVGRGGNMKPVSGGTYRVNQRMLEDLKAGVMGHHASNLGAVIAFEIAGQLGLPSFVVDPVVVDELDEIARISGIPEIQRKAKDHPLNQKAAARKAAAELGGEYSRLNFVVAHMGGGISVGVHRKGRIIDVNNALDGEGPFSPERAGGLPVGSLIDLCYSGRYTREEMKNKIVGRGGLVAYLGTNDGKEIQRRIREGDGYAKLVYQAMAYQLSKEIAAGAAVLKGEVDAIILTGGLANDGEFISWIEERVGFISKIKVYPGEFEMLALVQGVLRVLNGQEEAKEYV